MRYLIALARYASTRHYTVLDAVAMVLVSWMVWRTHLGFWPRFAVISAACFAAAFGNGFLRSMAEGPDVIAWANRRARRGPDREQL